MSKIVFALMSLAVMCSSAHAETVAATMTKWGLIGTWKINCDAAGDKLIYIAKKDGSVVHNRDFGDRKTSDRVRAVRITPEGWLELKIHFRENAAGERDRTFALKQIEPGVIQAVYNHSPDGRYTIKDGKLTANGNDAALQRKCR